MQPSSRPATGVASSQRSSSLAALSSYVIPLSHSFRAAPASAPRSVRCTSGSSVGPVLPAPEQPRSMSSHNASTSGSPLISRLMWAKAESAPLNVNAVLKLARNTLGAGTVHQLLLSVRHTRSLAAKLSAWPQQCQQEEEEQVSDLAALREQLSAGGLACMAMLVPILPGLGLAAAPASPGLTLADLLSNKVFTSGFFAWFAAQFMKIFTKRYKTGVWDPRAWIDSGGMPSSHSSLCAGVTTAVALTEGFGSPLFAMAVCFSVIVMYDAAGVRRHAGMHASVLNRVVDELMEDHPMASTPLKEVLGHTPRQVACGGLLGMATALLWLKAGPAGL